MQGELWEKYRQSPVRNLLRQVAANPKAPVHKDTIDGLNLDKRLRQAVVEAVDGIRREQALNVRQRAADKAAAVIVEAAGLDHETTSERNHRRASEGDLDAAAAVNAERDYYEAMADRIKGR